VTVANTDKTTYIRTAAIIALIGNAILAALKIVAGLLSGSGALVADGMDSSADVLISIITLVVVKVISKPADAKHPWGYGRAETIATAFLAFIIFYMGAQLIVGSTSKLIASEQSIAPSAAALVVTFISIAGKALLALSQYILGKRADSAMIKANAQNMLGDIYISAGVLLGLAISAITGSAYADTVIALLIGVWIIKTAVGIFREANLELMDGNTSTEPYKVIIGAVNAVEGAHNPHHARIRRIAGFWEINFDIYTDPNITILEAHGIASRVEEEIKRRLPYVFDVMIHVEPHGDNADEAYGLSEEAMQDLDNGELLHGK